MLQLFVKPEEWFDEELQTFIVQDEVELKLEHSLVSLSKWESFFEKPFLGSTDKTAEEIYWYIEAMNQTPNVAPEVFRRLSPGDLTKVNDYINAKMTATVFSDNNSRRNNEVVTAELIYYWMIAFTIPSEYQHWHLNRLLTLIRVCNLKNSKPKKMPRSEQLANQRRLNEERMAKYGTTG